MGVIAEKLNYADDTVKIRNNDMLMGVVAYRNGYTVTDIYGGYTFSDAENDEDAYSYDRNDDLVIAYCFDGKTLAVVIIDNDKDNE